MKKLLLVTTAIAGVAMLSSPAQAASLDVGAFFRGYAVYADNNETAGTATSLYQTEFRRDTRMYVTGEKTLDNGLTVGAYGRMLIANESAGTIAPDQIYAYFSGGWGRFDFGIEDGAAYLLQVAAPSADANIDGLRVNIAGLNQKTAPTSYNTVVFTNTTAFTTAAVDYQHADFKTSDRLTYMSPKFEGFQGGVSYAPKPGVAAKTGGMSLDKDGIGFADQDGALSTAAGYKDLIELAARWDGEFQGLGIAAGAGYSTSSVERKAVTGAASAAFDAGGYSAGDYYLNDGVDAYNGGLSFKHSGFTLGGSYKHEQTTRIADTLIAGASVAANQATGDITRKTYVVGGAYDNGAWHGGVSYLNQKTDFSAIAVGANANNIAATKYSVDKYAVGGGYTFGPGMTFRGSVAWGKFGDPTPANSNSYTQVAVGTDVKF